MTRMRRSVVVSPLLAVVVGMAVLLLLLSSSSSSSTMLTMAAAQASCQALPASDLNCTYNGYPLQDIDHDCMFGRSINVTCTVNDATTLCSGAREFNTTIPCMYCYQRQDMTCTNSTDCNVFKPDSRYIANCTAPPNTLCLGAREFSKNRKCNWSSGKVWSSAFLYSATLGGFGADRFYLGDIGYGVFKLLSFGGLAVWSMVDAILVAVGFLHPEGHWVLA